MKRKKKYATVITTGIHKNTLHIKRTKRDKKAFFLTVLFVAGLFLGTVFIKKANPTCLQAAVKLVQSFLSTCKANGFFGNFLFLFRFELFFTLACFLCGLSLAGEGMLWCVPLCKGFLIGAFSSLLYRQGALQGLSFFSLFLLAPSVFSNASSIFMCKESIFTERDINSALFFGGNPVKGKSFLKLYTLRYLILFIAMSFSALYFAVTLQIFHNAVSFTFLT